MSYIDNYAKMGLLTIIRKQKLKDNETRCLILGLDNAGKSTIVNGLLPPEQKTREITPTVGFQIKSFHLEDRLISLWDVGGQSTLRPFWDNYFDRTDVLVWVVDASQPFRLDESQHELQQLLQTHHSLVVVALNKVDLLAPGAADAQLAATEQKLATVVGPGARFVRCSGVSGQGLRALSCAMRTD